MIAKRSVVIDAALGSRVLPVSLMDPVVAVIDPLDRGDRAGLAPLSSAHAWRPRVVPSRPTAAESASTSTAIPSSMRLARRLHSAALLVNARRHNVRALPMVTAGTSFAEGFPT